MNKRKAFTLVEMLVVVAIVAIMALAAMFGYSYARQQARRDIAIDSLVSALREQQSLAKSGRIDQDEENLCYGMFISEDEPYVQLVQAVYYPVGPEGADYCDVSQDDLTDFQPLEDFQVRELMTFGSNANNIIILFKPPFAKIVLSDKSYQLPQNPGIHTTPDIVVSIGIPNDDEERSVNIDTSTGLIERLYEPL